MDDMGDMDAGDLGEDGMPGGCCGGKMSVKKMAPWKDMMLIQSGCCTHCMCSPSAFAIIPCSILCECCCMQFKCPIKFNMECISAATSMDPEQMMEHCPVPKCGTKGPGMACRGACRSFCCAELWECPCKEYAPCMFGMLGLYCKPTGCCPNLIEAQKEAFGKSPFEKKAGDKKKKAAGAKGKGKGKGKDKDKKKKDKEDDEEDDDNNEDGSGDGSGGDDDGGDDDGGDDEE